MTREVTTVARHVSLRELGDLFERDDFNSYPVEENTQVMGVVSKFDYLACFVFTPAHMTPRYEDLMRANSRRRYDLGVHLCGGRYEAD